MIVELFGPPGSGKTTLTQTLGARLKSAGRDVALWVSSRPGEEGAPKANERRASDHLAAARRISRPTLELLASLAGSRRAAETTAAMDRLLRMFPHGVLQSLRFRQYLIRLSNAWSRASTGDSIFIFDQGFIQAAYTLVAMRNSLALDDALATLDECPWADLVIEVAAPVELVERRLRDRERGMSAAERLLEFNPGTTVERARLAERFRDRLEHSGRRLLKVESANAEDFQESVLRVERKILALVDQPRERAFFELSPQNPAGRPA